MANERLTGKGNGVLSSYSKRHKLIGFTFAIPALIFLLCFVLYPVTYNIYLSFTDTSLSAKKAVHFVGLKNFQTMFSNKLFKKYFWNTCKWTFWSVLGQLVLGLALALLISRPMKGATAIRSFLLVPYVVPAVTLALVSKWILNSDYGIVSYWCQQAGWLDARQSFLAMKGPAMWVVVILNVWRSYPFPMLIYWAALKNIDNELYEAAMVDGSTKWQSFRYITLPQLRGTTAVLVVLRIVWTATYYDLIYMVTGGGPTGSTTTLPILIYQASFGSSQLGYAAAIAMVLGVLMLICIIFYIRTGVVDDKEEGVQTMKVTSFKKQKRQSAIITTVLLIFALLFVGFPLLWMALSSFKPGEELFTIPPQFMPKNWSLEWYKQAFANENVKNYFLNSLKIAGIVMIIDMIVGTLTAYSLTRFQYAGRKALMIAILASYCIPPIMLMLPLYKIMATVGLTGSHVGVIIGHLTITLPFSVWLLIPFYKKLPKEIDEAALIDGASEWQVFSRIDLPLIVSGVLSTGIMAFIMSWNEFLLSSVLVNKESMKTLTVGISNYISSTHIDWGIIMALGTITTVPVIILFAAVQKYFVEGMTAGAVKG